MHICYQLTKISFKSLLEVYEICEPSNVTPQPWAAATQRRVSHFFSSIAFSLEAISRTHKLYRIE